MKILGYLLICLGLLNLTVDQPTSHAQEEEIPSIKSSLAQKVFEQVQRSVFQIKTSFGPNTPKASYGTGFAIASSGLVITNYHVVASAIQEEKGYHLYLMDGEQSHEAHIVSIDLIHDLALLRVDREFSDHLKLAPSMPAQGAKIFSIGMPLDLNMSITEGNYNGILKEGPYSQVHMASPLNSGMSGGPTVNEKGEVVGVNVSVLFLSQSVSFSVPVDHVKRLKESYNPSDSVAMSNDSIHLKIQEQIELIQNELVMELSKGFQDRQTIGDWIVPKPHQFAKCWGNNDDDDDGFYQSLSEQCYLNSSAFLNHGISTGTFEFSYQTFSSSRLTYWQLLNVAKQGLNSNYSSNILFSTFSHKNEILTKFDCNEGKIMNRSNTPFFVRYCLRGYVKYPKLYNFEIRLLSLNTERPILSASATLTGFTLENITNFFSQFIEGIRLNEPGRP